MQRAHSGSPCKCRVSAHGQVLGEVSRPSKGMWVRTDRENPHWAESITCQSPELGSAEHTRGVHDQVMSQCTVLKSEVYPCFLCVKGFLPTIGLIYLINPTGGTFSLTHVTCQSVSCGCARWIVVVHKDRPDAESFHPSVVPNGGLRGSCLSVQKWTHSGQGTIGTLLFYAKWTHSGQGIACSNQPFFSA